ncbi:MAG: sigma 54-interacting transcriptional regulator, partial [Deltaproteobacteria bacterium]|nr:sigma 54-interacting transcriptional regulator [Deltaproteobacteria bacterium]MBW2027045.1 sigma 54-interacting transcriptional regulator [Deltaproteobacteria bacterium]
THRNLEEMVAKGTFRKDLFYRLNVVRLHLPALRERGEDILLLLDHFVRLFSHKLNKTIDGFSPQALAKLKKYPYPGNVRELRNIVEYAVNVCDARVISPRHLPPYLLESEQEQAALMARTPVDTTAGMQASPLADFASTDNWSDIERKIILDALARAKGRRNEAARLLGWARSTLWRKMKQYKIN